jgi:GH15 family glucan-1,4-alpha-glucosidase
MYKEQAFQVLKNSSTAAGFLATATGDENYNRVWSRDSAITALAILLHEREELYPSVKASILTLAQQQNDQGLIPSNVAVAATENASVSYGTLVGRVDAQTWWLIQTCLYLSKTQDLELKTKLKAPAFQVLNLLDAWEFNARHLVYTPLGGNWADEYILSGYTLYDNLLRYWALKLCSSCWPEVQQLQQKILLVRNAIEHNFCSTKPTSEQTLHPRIFQTLQKQQIPFLPACFDAAQYTLQWDAAANGLALLLGFEIPGLTAYIKKFESEQQQLFIPSFWPVIQKQDAAWALLENQYNYSFKNEPYQFHNGGSWPVMSGILAMGLQKQSTELARQIAQSYEQFLEQTDTFHFSEYISTNDFKPRGKQQMCFSASGYLFMCADPAQILAIFSL